VEGHVASLELAHARPTLLPSMGGSRDSLIRRLRTLALLHDRAEAVAHRLTTLDPSSTLCLKNQDSRDTGSMLPTTQSGSSSRESSPMLPFGRGRHHCTASCLSSGSAQPTWIRELSKATSLAKTHCTALLQLNALAASLQDSANKLSLGADSRVTRLLALIRRLYNKCCRHPQEKDAHKSWWETIVTLCWAAQRIFKSWPESYDRAIREVLDS